MGTMKKFYLKIWLLAFIMVFATMPAVADRNQSVTNNDEAALQAKCNQNNADACLELGDLQIAIDAEAAKALYEKAYPVYEKKCENEADERACVICMGMFEMYKIGDGRKILQYAQERCTDKKFSGCYLLGKFYLSGDVVDQNIVEAYDLFEKSCNDGVLGLACSVVGLRYLNKACSLDNAKACLYIGKMDEITDHKSSAYKYLQRACELGEEKACSEDHKQSKSTVSTQNTLKENSRCSYLNLNSLHDLNPVSLKAESKRARGLCDKFHDGYCCLKAAQAYTLAACSEDRLCIYAGMMWEIENQQELALKNFSIACKEGIKGACDRLDNLKINQIK